MYKILR